MDPYGPSCGPCCCVSSAPVPFLLLLLLLLLPRYPARLEFRQGPLLKAGALLPRAVFFLGAPWPSAGCPCPGAVWPRVPSGPPAPLPLAAGDGARRRTGREGEGEKEEGGAGEDQAQSKPITHLPGRGGRAMTTTSQPTNQPTNQRVGSLALLGPQACESANGWGPAWANSLLLETVPRS